ncbi:MAG: hypothetical protein K9N07_05955 [Candidatus Cloacimonetes bacterium]|nr:hypothetical protein [Candidatus Cloacimonadota bacterium]
MVNRPRQLMYFVLLLIATIFSSNCGKKSGDVEPNNQIDKASEITFGKPFDIRIDPVGDIDWYKVEITGQGYLTVQANNVPEDLNLEVGFALYEEWEDSKVKWLKKWLKLPDALFVNKTSTYYFAVIDNNNDKASKDPIQLKVDFIPEFDQSEPNNEPGNATSVKFGTVIKPAIFPTGDSDWFKLNVTKPGYLLAKSKDVPKELTPNIYFAKYDEWAARKIQKIRNWHKLPDACRVNEPGEYYILLEDDYNNQSSETPFSFLVEFLNEMDMNEPNDHFTTAKAASRGDTLQIAIFPKGDKDYYKLNIERGNKLKILTTGYGDLVPEIKLYSLNENNKLHSESRWEKLPCEVDVIPKTEYYLLIHNQYDNKESEQVFEIRIE